jgi:hypothetical protein
MAGRSGDTFKKRQKEVARAEKQREKIAQRLQRKLEKRSPETSNSVSGDRDVNDVNIERANPPQESDVS